VTRKKFPWYLCVVATTGDCWFPWRALKLFYENKNDKKSKWKFCFHKRTVMWNLQWVDEFFLATQNK